MTHFSGRHPQKHAPYGNGTRIGTAKAGTFKVDPLLVSAGVGLRF